MYPIKMMFVVQDSRRRFDFNEGGWDVVEDVDCEAYNKTDPLPSDVQVLI